MKKRYSKPIVEIIALESENLMVILSCETGEVGTGEGEVGDETPDLVVERRGEWGNLWTEKPVEEEGRW